MIKFLTYLFFICLTFHSLAQTKADSLKTVFKQALINNDIHTQKQLADDVLKQYSSYTVLYYKNLLSNTLNNSVLITNGLEDTYPIIALQHAKKINSKTKVISLSLLSNQQYKNLISKQLSINLKNDKTLALAQLLNQSKQKIYISSTVNPKYYQTKANKLFLTGLVLELNSNNQLVLLNQFWDNFKAKNIVNLNLNSSEKRLFKNFLPPLITLYKLYIINQYNTKQLKQDILKFAKQINQEKPVKQILKKYEQ